MIRASAFLAFPIVLCLLGLPVASQTSKDPKRNPAVAGPEKKQNGKPDSKADPKASSKPDPKKTTKAPETLDELKEFALSKLDATQKAAVAKLKADVETLESKAEITAAMVQDLKTALVNTMKGILKPSETSALKLAGELATMTADGKVNGENLLKIQGNVQAVLFSTAVTDKQLEELKSSIQSIAKGANLSAQDTSTLVNSVESLAKNAGKEVPIDPKKVSTPAKPKTAK